MGWHFELCPPGQLWWSHLGSLRHLSSASGWWPHSYVGQLVGGWLAVRVTRPNVTHHPVDWINHIHTVLVLGLPRATRESKPKCASIFQVSPCLTKARPMTKLRVGVGGDYLTAVWTKWGPILPHWTTSSKVNYYRNIPTLFSPPDVPLSGTFHGDSSE